MDPLADLSLALRRSILRQSLASNVGHIGSALSIVEILVALWGRVLRHPGTDRPDRDRFILSKGHAALALYCVLRSRGLMDDATLATFCTDGSLLGQHPEATLPGIELSTGSLGHGLSAACGIALGLRRRGIAAGSFVLMSDAECNEGQVWEAAQFAAHHGLSSVTAVVDQNGMQALGATKDILDLSPLTSRFAAFGWDAVEASGHDLADLVESLTPSPDRTRPRVVVARTILGKGVPFMEGRLEWHYRNLTPELARKAFEALGEQA